MAEVLEIADDYRKGNDELLLQIEGLKAKLSITDEGKEIERLNDMLNSLEGSMRGKFREICDLGKKVNYYTDILKKVRKQIGVTSNQDILPAIQALNEG
jgi:hypothetical protein